MTDFGFFENVVAQLQEDRSCNTAVISLGVAKLGDSIVKLLIDTIEVFDDFCFAVDQTSLHHTGWLRCADADVLFRIDYQDRFGPGPSRDPADPVVTERIVTLRLATES